VTKPEWISFRVSERQKKELKKKAKKDSRSVGGLIKKILFGGER